MAKNQKIGEKSQVIFITFICLLFFLPFLANPQILTTKDNDLGRTYIPIISFIRDSFYVHKQIPLWRPDQLMGESLVSNPISTIFYPANVIFLIFETHHAAVVYLLFHFILAAVSTFYLARSFKISAAASTVAAIFYAFSFKMAVHLEAGHLTMVAAASYLPLAFLSIRNLLKGLNVKWIITGSLSLTFMYFTYPTIFYYSCVFLTLYWFYYHATHGMVFKKSRARVIKLQVPFLLLIIATFGLSAIVLLPHLEFGPLSTRSNLTLVDVAQPVWNLKRYVLSLVFPYPISGELDHEAFLYLGFIPTALAIFGFLKLKTLQKITLFIFALFALAFAAGTSTPFFETAYNWLPFLKYLRITTRFWFVVALLVALTGAYATNHIRSKKLIYLLIALFLIEFFAITNKRISRVPTVSFENESLYQYLAKDPDFFRIYCTTHCLNPQLVTKYHLQIIDGENPIQDASFIRFLEKAGNYRWNQFAVIFPPYQVWQVASPPVPNAEILSSVNVKYIASTYPIVTDKFTPVGNFDKIYLYENMSFKKRAFFEDDDAEVKIAKYSPNQIDLSFTPEPTIRKLVISDNYFDGWIAKINHEKHQVLPAPNQSRMVIIPENTKDLQLRFSPASFELGKTITISTLIVLGMWYIRLRTKNG